MYGSFFHFVTIHAFDRQTDRQTDTFLIASQRWHSMQRGKTKQKSEKQLSTEMVIKIREVRPKR